MTSSALMNTYGRQPITFSHGKGVRLYDDAGNEYLDAISGIGVNSLGHNHPAVTAAITSQAEQLIHTSNLYGVERQEQLAERLCKVSGMDNVFFSNSGAEANEAAIKIARMFGHNNGIEKPTIIVMENAFHGRTMATLTATGNRKIQAGFEPLLSGFVRAPYSDLDAIKNIAANNNDIVAVLAEPIQGEGGINILPDNFLSELRVFCDEKNWLLMLDEVQTGNGRTGRYFAYQHENILPDVVTTAKGLGNGLPIGACLAQGKAAKVFGPGNHGSTYGGNPLVCAAAKAVVDTVVEDKLCENADAIGAYLLDQFSNALADKPLLRNIRGKGLMIGIELTTPCAELVNIARSKGLLMNVTVGQVIRLLPPLIINQQEADELVAKLIAAISDFEQQTQ